MIVPSGFSLWGICAGIKRKRLDLGIIYCDTPCQATGVFTKNANPAYSVVLSKRNIKYPIKAVLVNSGNANCFSHKEGLKDTEQIVSKLASSLGVKKENILIASTGIIGKKLPKEKIIKSFPLLLQSVTSPSAKKIEGVKNFSHSILTTDTFEKISYAKVNFGKKKVNILGCTKGAGMICPDMATMLGFILTDAFIDASLFKKIVKEAVEESFNSISIDACMSTNDTVFCLSSGKVLLAKGREIDSFSKAIKRVCLDLAKMIVKDAEGATKFVEIEVKGAKTKQEAKTGALYIANSNLFKSALYGANPNWGRIVAALGHANVKAGNNISIKNTSLKKKDVKVTVDLKKGKHKHSVYTSDLTPEYVKINADYS